MKITRTWMVPALIAGALFGATATGGTASAQTYGDDTPVVSVNGQVATDGSAPVITDSQPTLSGQVEQSGGAITLSLSPANVSLTAPVDGSGNFSVRLDAPLPDGTQTISVNNQVVGQFTIDTDGSATPSVVPGAPETGSGEGGGDSPKWSIVLAIAAGLVIAGSVFGYQGIRSRTH